MDDADITILGAGPVGSALALLFAREAPDPSRIVLCRAAAPGAAPAPAMATRPVVAADPAADESRVMTSPTAQRGPAAPPSPAAAGARADPRALALNYGSRLLLERLDAWPALGAAIHTIHVSQRGRLGRTLIRHTDFGVPELGAVHAYGRVQATLHAALAAAGVRIRDGAAAIVNEDAHGALIAQSDATWRTRVAVQAEGGDAAPGEMITRDYDQRAVLGLVRAARPQPGWAWERFTREGPLALLPIRTHADSDAHDTYSMVWCCTPEHAARLHGLDDDAFGVALHAAFGERLGGFTPAGPRHVFPLRLRWRRTSAAGRRVAIGNAAQTLHPVAGQGLNLGLRDAARLAHALNDWLRTPAADPRPVLADFARSRRADRGLTAGITDLLPRVFATGQPIVEHACGLALLALDTLPPLRRPLARQLMQGLRG